MSELGPLAKRLSEVDVGTPNNLKVSLEVQGRVIDLSMGDRNFQVRLKEFLDSYNGDSQAVGATTSFDLRLDDRITTRE